jgi:transposase
MIAKMIYTALTGQLCGSCLISARRLSRFWAVDERMIVPQYKGAMTMKVFERSPGDIAELNRRVRVERKSIQRDRYRAVLLALEGQESVAIAKAVGRARRSVQDWVYAYRDGGIDALIAKKQTGKPPKLTAEQQVRLQARLDAGAVAKDGVCTLRGKDILRILETEFGVKHTLGSIYGVLRRLGYSCLTPRPQHEQNDPAAIEQFKREAPFLSRP